MTPQVELVKTSVLRLLPLDVLSYHGFVSTYGRDEVSPGPKVLTHKIPLLLSVHAGEVDRTLSLDEPDHLRHCVFRQNRSHHVHVIRQKMPFLDPAFLLPGQLAAAVLHRSSFYDAWE